MTTMQTTAAGSRSTRSSSVQAQWSDLPDDVLDSIRVKITSLNDRVRLGAVCRPWRAAVARLPALRAAPLLLLSPCSETGGTKHLCGVGPGDSWFLRIADKLVGKWLVGSHVGGWVAAFDSSSDELVLVNLFSGAEVGVYSRWPGTTWQHQILPVVFSDCPTSSTGSMLATITNQMESIALCKVGCGNGWTTKEWKGKKFTYITFCNGALYALAHPGEELVKFEIDMEEGSPLVVKSTHSLPIQSRHGPTQNDDLGVYECYILELHGKPSKAVRTRWVPNREPFFKVFELANTDIGEIYQYKWAEVTSFGDYALFLGQGSSKAVHVPMGAEARGFKRNHIYYSIATRSIETNLRGDEVYSLRLHDDRVMYCREDQSIGDGLERTGYFVTGWTTATMWIHPPDF